MFSFLIAAFSVCYYANAGYSETNPDNTVGQGSASSHSTGTGTGYGFSGSFSGQGVPNNFGVPPLPSIDFSGAIGQYLDSLQKYNQEFLNNGGGHAFSISTSSGTSNVRARSFIISDHTHQVGLDNNRLQQNIPGSSQGVPDIGSRINAEDSYGGGFGSSFSGSFGGSDGASASGSIGPGGVYQSASVFPENPNNPNIQTRTGANEGSPDGVKFYGVSTSSQSGTSNVDGKPTKFNQASTTINDNGKVSTYTVKNP